MIIRYLCNKKLQNWSLRLSVRTRGFHPRKRGSIPLGTAIKMSFFVYMLKCKTCKNKRTYVGYTKDLKKRIDLHNTGKGAKFTRGNKWIVIFKKKFLNKKKAMKYEYNLKNDIKKRLQIYNNFK